MPPIAPPDNELELATVTLAPEGVDAGVVSTRSEVDPKLDVGEGLVGAT
jgi:hypothetical protein